MSYCMKPCYAAQAAFQHLCWFGCPSLDAAISRIRNSWPKTLLQPAKEREMFNRISQDKQISHLHWVRRHIWSHLLWLEKQVLITIISRNDIPTTDTVKNVTTATASERREIHILNVMWPMAIYSMFLESHIQTIKLTKRLNFKMNRWSVRAPARRANHHESFIHRLGVEAFQDHPPLSWFSSHNWTKGQTSHSITYVRKCFGSVQMKVFYLPLMVPCLSQ